LDRDDCWWRSCITEIRGWLVRFWAAADRSPGDVLTVPRGSADVGVGVFLGQGRGVCQEGLDFLQRLRGRVGFGDPAAFEAFYRRHVAVVSRFLSRRVIDPHLVADLTAEVFHEVIRSAHTYRPGRGSELAWLYGIARNVLANNRRREVLRLRALFSHASFRIPVSHQVQRHLLSSLPAARAIQQCASWRTSYQEVTG
jgi:hypothetical protein